MTVNNQSLLVYDLVPQTAMYYLLMARSIQAVFS